MKLCYSKVAGPSVSSPDPTPMSEISMRWEAIAAGEKHELCSESLSMPSVFGDQGCSYLFEGVFTGFWLKHPGALTWGIFQIP